MWARTIWLFIGLVLVIVAVFWFATPLDDIVLEQLRPATEPGTAELGREADGQTRGLRKFPEKATDMLKIALDVANAVIGLIGIALSYRSIRARRA